MLEVKPPLAKVRRTGSSNPLRSRNQSLRTVAAIPLLH